MLDTDKVYTWVEPDDNNNPRHCEWSGYEILLWYWYYWSTTMMEKRPDLSEEITPENCITSFRLVHWAEEKL